MEGIIFIGIQGSGKSTFFQQYFTKTHIRLNMDMLKTRHRESILMKACIEAKQPFVIDNTNPSRSDRKKYIDILLAKNFSVKGYFFQSRIQNCLKRNQKRSKEERVPDIGIKGTHSKLELPSYQEGFTELYFVSLKNYEFIVQDWNDEV